MTARCTGRNARDTGPCPKSATGGFPTCARCGGRGRYAPGYVAKVRKAEAPYVEPPRKMGADLVAALVVNARFHENAALDEHVPMLAQNFGADSLRTWVDAAAEMLSWALDVPREWPEAPAEDAPAASAYDGLDAAGRCEFHVATMREFEATAREWLPEATRSEEAGEAAGWIEGHALRAAVALLEWCAEGAEEHAASAGMGVATAESRGAACTEEGSGLDEALAYIEQGRTETEHPVEDVQPDKVLSERGVDLWHATHLQLAARTNYVDAVICDPPYSERTHKGHDDGTSQANRVADWANRAAEKGRATRSGGVSLARTVAYAAENTTERKALDYPPWTDADVETFVATWAPLNRGWFAMFTDHLLARSWEKHLEAAGLYVFSPLACVEPGSRFRAVGDGPSQWSVWLVVARPRSGAWLDAWRARRVAAGLPRALRGAHVLGDGEGDKRTGTRGDRVTGAKPLAMMRGVVEDYSTPGELVVDPTCGGGTTGNACIGLGRRALLGDCDAAHVAIAAERLRSLPAAPSKGGTFALFGAVGS